ncbi:AraC family transcriptional regulator [Lacticaseibacillus zhaodongensis]|uniref:AraC family transcriptional regulator n=1 Tax=Lacticaseibacillus zhaodongensis TaxID=2668065 RepID=UPI0012D2B35D|nr:AraC family transcriptional regulator [Lacticaseibacillus zhaodongensis]
MAKQQGFPDEYLYVLPASIIKNFAASPALQQLYITDLGFYPNAKDHYVHRQNGTSEWILILCVRGQGHVKVGRKTVDVGRGSLVLLPPNQEHTYWASTMNPWDIFWVHFTGTNVTDYLPQTVADNPNLFIQTHIKPRDTDLLMTQFKQMMDALTKGFAYNAIFFASQTLGAMLAYIWMQTQDDSDAVLVGNPYINQAVQYIYDHLDDKVSLSGVSRQLGVSASYLSRIFRDTVGVSVNQFIVDVKLRQTVHYLLDTTISIRQIASGVGFTDQYYFSRVFKKNMGMSPLEYRKHGAAITTK